MSAQVVSVPGQTEGRRKAFLERKSIDLSSKLSLRCGGNINYYKSAHHHIPTRENREHPGNLQKKISKFSFQLSVEVYYLFDQTEGKVNVVFGVHKKGDQTVRLPPRALGCLFFREV